MISTESRIKKRYYRSSQTFLIYALLFNKNKCEIKHFPKLQPSSIQVRLVFDRVSCLSGWWEGTRYFIQKLRFKPFINKINVPNFLVDGLRERVSQMCLFLMNICTLCFYSSSSKCLLCTKFPFISLKKNSRGSVSTLSKSQNVSYMREIYINDYMVTESHDIRFQFGVSRKR